MSKKYKGQRYVNQKRTEENQITKLHLDLIGIKSTEMINEWYKKARADKYRIDGILQACEMLRKYKEKHIYIFGDYDVDGICATSILMKGFAWTGFKNARYRTPHRFTEGFGMAKTMVDEIEYPDSLIITVDNGIAANDTVRYAKEKGFTVIVTDHHEPNVENGEVVLPEADLIIDPKAIPGSADYDGYCGAGIAYKIVKRLLGNDRRINLLLPLAALATVCDQMPLTEENYYFVRQGFSLLNKEVPCMLMGMKVLGNVLGISYWDVTAFGFGIGPAINAPERLENGGAMKSIRLMLTDDAETCRAMALELKEYNEKRKAVVAEATAKTMEIIDKSSISYPIIVYNPDIGEGIIGIIAGKVVEKYGVPAGIFTKSDNPDILKGSFRSTDDYNIKAHLDMCGDDFICDPEDESETDDEKKKKVGGHAGAAGASVRRDMFEKMCRDLCAVSKRPENIEENIRYYDADITADKVSPALVENEKFQPFGNGNPNLRFRISGFKVIPNRYGEIKKHLAKDGIRIHSTYCDAVGFGLWGICEKITKPMTVTLYGEISYNRFNGKVTPQIIFDDIEY